MRDLWRSNVCFFAAMTFATDSGCEQAQLTLDIRATASQHQSAPLYLWRTALERVNSEVITVPPYCIGSALASVYYLFNVVTEA